MDIQNDQNVYKEKLNEQVERNDGNLVGVPKRPLGISDEPEPVYVISSTDLLVNDMRRMDSSTPNDVGIDLGNNGVPSLGVENGLEYQNASQEQRLETSDSDKPETDFADSSPDLMIDYLEKQRSIQNEVQSDSNNNAARRSAILNDLEDHRNDSVAIEAPNPNVEREPDEAMGEELCVGVPNLDVETEGGISNAVDKRGDDKSMTKHENFNEDGNLVGDSKKPSPRWYHVLQYSRIVIGLGALGVGAALIVYFFIGNFFATKPKECNFFQCFAEWIETVFGPDL